MKLAKNLNLERCPHCSVAHPNLIKLHLVETTDFKNENHRRWALYQCNTCGGLVIAYSFAQRDIVEEYFPSSVAEIFEYEYLSEEVADDFKEALKCYSNHCYNAFAAMCRRTVQTAANALGVKGKDKVKKQISELKNLAGIDDDTYEILEQIIISGHDGAHPHLPKLNLDRALLLLILMKDVLNELFVRKARILESIKLRDDEIEQKTDK